MIDAVYDACVLYSGSLRDILLHLAKVKLVHPHWSNEIHEEWIHSLLRNRPDLSQESLQLTRRRMDAEFKNSLTQSYESYLPKLTLPDLNDNHVLAVAIQKKAKYIVTFNLKDFPKKILQSYGIEAISPDEFVFQLIQESPYFALRAVKNHRLSLIRPPKTVDEYLATLEKQGLSKTVAFLREHKTDI
ncbi:MAG: PIN domain-containing protein [Planctomycetaceae bacterium]|nr:PIN domain-containing protein [Planctomycetaceae bacterium]